MKTDHILLIGLSVLLCGAIWYRMNDSGSPALLLGNLEQVTLHDLQEESDTFAELLAKHPDAHVLILELENCASCLYKGMNDLSALVTEGHDGFVVVVNDWQEEVVGWSGNYPQVPFFRMTRSDLYTGMNIPHLPVLLGFEKGSLTSHRFITVN